MGKIRVQKMSSGTGPAAGRLVVVLVMIHNHGKKQKSANEAAILRTTHIYIYIIHTCEFFTTCILYTYTYNACYPIILNLITKAINMLQPRKMKYRK